MLKATWQDESTILYRDLTYECRGQAPLFSSQKYWGTVSELQAQGLTLEPLPNAVCCVPYQAALESDGAAKYLTYLLGDAKLLAPPKRGPAPQVDAPFEHKAGIEQAPQGLRLIPVRAGNALQETAIDSDSPGNSPVPAGSADSVAAKQPPPATPSGRQESDQIILEPNSAQVRVRRWGASWHKPAPKTAREAQLRVWPQGGVTDAVCYAATDTTDTGPPKKEAGTRAPPPGVRRPPRFAARKRQTRQSRVRQGTHHERHVARRGPQPGRRRE